MDDPVPRLAAEAAIRHLIIAHGRLANREVRSHYRTHLASLDTLAGWAREITRQVETLSREAAEGKGEE
jgi:hypothetical protein